MVADMLVNFARYFIAVSVALLYFRVLDKPNRMVAIQVIIAFIVNVAGYALRIKKINNIPLYNIYLLLDYGLLLLAAGEFLKHRVRTSYFRFGLSLVLALWCFEIAKGGLNVFAQLTYIAGSFLLIIAYLSVIYSTAMQHTQRFVYLPAFWISTAIVVFYACNIPNFSMIGFLAHCTRDNAFVSAIILDSLNNIRYGFTGIAFLIIARHNAWRLNPKQHAS